MRWIIVAATLALAACGDSSNNANNGQTNNGQTSNNGQSNNGQASNNGQSNNGQASNNGQSNNGSTNNQTSCTPMTCEDLAAVCGAPDDGCGTPLDCGTCDAGFACSEGACELGVADACAADGDCAAGLTCFLQTEAGWTDGYCLKECAADADCPEGSHCAGDSCLKTCDSASDCRDPAYGCFDGDDDQVSECLPLGVGQGVVGDPCLSYADCGGGESGACVVQSGEDFVDGYCTITGCTVDAGCPTGSNCLDATSPPICLKNCDSEADCRADYQCTMATDAGDSCIPANL